MSYPNTNKPGNNPGSVGVQSHEPEPFLPGRDVAAEIPFVAAPDDDREFDGILANEGGLPSPGVNEYALDVDGDGSKDGDPYFDQVDTPAPIAGSAARRRYRRPFRSQHAIGSGADGDAPDFETKAERARDASAAAERARQAEIVRDHAREDEMSL